MPWPTLSKDDIRVCLGLSHGIHMMQTKHMEGNSLHFSAYYILATENGEATYAERYIRWEPLEKRNG